MDAKRELKQRQRNFRHNEVMNQHADDEDEANQLNFDIDDGFTVKNERLSVKICGRYILSSPSDNRMSQDGWLRLCVIAKDSDRFDA